MRKTAPMTTTATQRRWKESMEVYSAGGQVGRVGVGIVARGGRGVNVPGREETLSGGRRSPGGCHLDVRPTRQDLFVGRHFGTFCDISWCDAPGALRPLVVCCTGLIAGRRPGGGGSGGGDRSAARPPPAPPPPRGRPPTAMGSTRGRWAGAASSLRFRLRRLGPPPSRGGGTTNQAQQTQKSGLRVGVAEVARLPSRARAEVWRLPLHRLELRTKTCRPAHTN